MISNSQEHDSGRLGELLFSGFTPMSFIAYPNPRRKEYV
jgi:hypothetical protein